MMHTHLTPPQRLRHRGLTRLAQSLAAVITLMAAALVPLVPAHAAAQGVSGFFAAAQSTDAANRDQLEQMQAAGADTVITFGYTLATIDAAAAKTGRFADCTIDGKSCYDAVRSGITVRKVLAYAGNTAFTSEQRLCARDVFTSAGSTTYAVMGVPVNGSCTTATSFDIVMTAHSGVDKAASVTSQAGALGMKHYIGMPAPDMQADTAWLPDTSYLATLKDFTGRFAMATGSPSGLGGFYQHREMPLSDYPDWDGMYSLYSMQNAAIAAKSTTKVVMISPYIDARKASNQTVAKAKAAAAKLAGTRSGLSRLILAPQDGMGTGKGSAYGGDKWGWRVDPYQRTIVGDVTNAEAYFASSEAYFQAVKDGIGGDANVALWGNLEGMAPIIASGSNANPCSTGHSDTRGFTLDSRMIEQLREVAGITAKNVSYHWDYYLCTRNGGPALKDTIAGLG